MDGIGDRTLRILPVEAALKISGLNFAARQRHGLENALVPECRVAILLFWQAGAVACIPLRRVPVLFSHTD
jgi:hypothetical protein